MTEFSQTDFEAYLDDALPVEEMARIERALRERGISGRLAWVDPGTR